jgi:hypothetical protein
MKKLVSISAIAAMIGLPLIAMAQTLPNMPNLPSSVPAGTAVCRPAKASEKANASMGSTQMMCRSVDVVKVNAAIKKIRSLMAKQQSAPAATTSNAATDASTQEMLQAQAQLNSEFHVPVIPGGNGGVED